VGLIWIVQVVHYPLFVSVGADHFVEYESSHKVRITWVVAPGMFAELGLAVALVFALSGTALVLAWAGLVMLAFNWGSTFFVQVPLHARLSGGFDASAHRLLVRTNWARTACWSARGVLALVMIAQHTG
jgi:hypothetical protein